jgi:hypothetical protein
MGDASGPARGCPFLRRHAGDAHAFALRELLGAVAGQAHRREQGVTQPLRATVVLAFAVQQRDPVLRRIFAGGMSDLIDHAFDRPEGPVEAIQIGIGRRK